MRGVVPTVTIVLLVLGLLAWARPTESQEPLPTPRGQLGGREPLGPTDLAPSPLATAPLPPTAPPDGTPVGAATPVAGATPIGAASPVARAGGDGGQERPKG